MLSAIATLASQARAAETVSFTKDVQPILNKTCVSCHKPGKTKGDLDLTTYKGLMNGGKSGQAVRAFKPDQSFIIEQIGGPEPAMPDKGDKLTEKEVAVIAKWIKEGANDDTPAGKPKSDTGTPVGPQAPAEPSVYKLPAIINAMAISPDGKLLAVGGRHEVILHAAEGSGIVRRLPSGSPRTTWLGFTKDNRLIALGGEPGVFGQLLVWDAGSDFRSIGNWQIANDLPLGPSLSPDGQRVAFGGADKLSRVFSLADGKELLKIDQHIDWVFSTAFGDDGKHLFTSGRDKNLKVVDGQTGRFIDQINDPVEPVMMVAKVPGQDLVLCGSTTGGVRIYRTTGLKKRTEQDRDPNRAKEVERQPGPVNAMTFNADASLLAIASTGEVRVYSTKDWSKKAVLSGHAGPVYTATFSQDGKQIHTGGYDGTVRTFDAATGKPGNTFIPFPIGASTN